LYKLLHLKQLLAQDAAVQEISGVQPRPASSLSRRITLWVS